MTDKDAPRLETSGDYFLFVGEYEDRMVPKEAGFRWHAGERCRVRGCAACKQKLGKIWWTQDVVACLKALARSEAARENTDAALLARLSEVGEAALAEREEIDRKELLAAKRKKLERATTLRMSRAEDADLDVPLPEGLSYLPYQRAAIAFALRRPNSLFADEMGLGKTVEALGVVNMEGDEAEHVLIVCPASLKLNWARECERWLVGERTIGVAGKTWPEDADVVIINYDILGKWEHELEGEWSVLIVDECHYVKNKDAKRSKRLYAIEARRKLFLTGTPILNRPAELHAIVSYLEPEEFGHFWNFAKRYCAPIRNNFGWDVTGASNMVELHDKLRSTIMIRRTKAQVLPDLPPKRRQVIELPADSISRLIETEQAAWAEHRQRLVALKRMGKVTGGAGAGSVSDGERGRMRQEVNDAFGELSRLRHETAKAKVPLVVEHLKAAGEESGKIVVFAHHKAVVTALAEAFGDTAVTLAGGDSPESRQAAVDRFQEDPSCRFFIGSITAAGFGLTLTASSHVVFAELDWVPANMTQAEDRTHRIGQEDSVLVQHLVLEGSLDASMVRTLIKKQEVVDKVVDGSKQGELFDPEYAEALIEAAKAEREAGAS